MPATSQAQQRYFGMVAAGKIPAPAGMTEEQVKHFARTKRKGLPKRAPKDHARNIAAARVSRRRHAPVAQRTMAAHKSAGGYR